MHLYHFSKTSSVCDNFTVTFLKLFDTTRMQTFLTSVKLYHIQRTLLIKTTPYIIFQSINPEEHGRNQCICNDAFSYIDLHVICLQLLFKYNSLCQ